MPDRLDVKDADAIIRGVFAGRELPRRDAAGRVIWPADWEPGERVCWSTIDEAFRSTQMARAEPVVPRFVEPERPPAKHRRRTKLMNPALIGLLTGGVATLLLLHSSAG